MRNVRLTMQVRHKSAGEVYRTLSDFARYPELSDAVRSVEVSQATAARAVSQWEVTFRAGLLRWTEEDFFSPDTCTIRFRQLEGDIDIFEGSWQCTDLDAGSQVVFEANLDMGIPSLADALEPIAVRALVENTVSIVTGLVGPVDLIENAVSVPSGSPS